MKKIYLILISLVCFSALNAQVHEQNGNLNFSIHQEPFLGSSVQSAVEPGLPHNGKIYDLLNNQPLFATAVRNGKLHGYWQSWYQNGRLCDSGRFVKGLPDGVWKHWNENGELVAVRTYSANKYQRISNEMLHFNHKKVNYPLAELYHRHKQEALMYLEVSYSFPGAVEKQNGFSLTGRVTKNIIGGNSYSPVFRHALHHGIFINFYPGGIVKDSGDYKDGLRHGLWTHADIENGIIQRGTYFNGIKVKEWRSYNDLGKLQELVVYSTYGVVKKKKSFQ